MARSETPASSPVPVLPLLPALSQAEVREGVVHVAGTLGIGICRRRAGLFLLGAGALAIEGLTDEIRPSDTAVVLGNQVHPDGTASARLAGRLDQAVALYRHGDARSIIVSVALGREGVPEGDAMKLYLVERGVPASAMIVDNAGADTWATARNAAAIMQTHRMTSAIVVSQHFHIARTKLAFRKHGLQVGGAHARFFELRDLYSTARKIPAYVKYLLRPAD